MSILCSNCQKLIGCESFHTDPDLGPTLCPECGDQYIAEYGGVSLSEHLDRFEEPIMVFNQDVRVVACNRPARRTVEMSKIRPYGLLSGEFLDCRNASLGEGCGETPYCSQCVIRNSVNQTLQTGKPVENVPGLFTGSGENGTCTYRWNISTRKVGETVHLSIHQPATKKAFSYK
jgi:hypothetical protein